MGQAQLFSDRDNFVVRGVCVVGDCCLPLRIKRGKPNTWRSRVQRHKFSLKGLRIGYEDPTLKVLDSSVPVKLGDLRHHLWKHNSSPILKSKGRALLHDSPAYFKLNVLEKFCPRNPSQVGSFNHSVLQVLTNKLDLYKGWLKKNRLKIKGLESSIQNIVSNYTPLSCSDFSKNLPTAPLIGST